MLRIEGIILPNTLNILNYQLNHFDKSFGNQLKPSIAVIINSPGHFNLLLMLFLFYQEAVMKQQCK